jgi:RNA-splicing ligase RtcB
MIELKGKCNTAKLFTRTAEQTAVAQIQQLLDQEFTAGSQIRVMPDAHAGMGCTIGTTMTIKDKVVPNLVGVDIGCGMETARLEDAQIALGQLDKAIHRLIPVGFDTRKSPHPFNDEIDLAALRCAKHVDLKRAVLSIGTLGGGNHFIELAADDEGRLSLIIHSGSRNLGKQVCEHYQNAAAASLGRKGKGADWALAYLEGHLFDDYLHDMAIVQRYAGVNRNAMMAVLQGQMNFRIAERFSTIHNYIDLDSMILRKGAVSAKAGEKMLIPMNMRDGSLVCIGKGNPDWNYSAPHGAGRIMSRKEAKKRITLSEYKKAMEGIYTSTLNSSTIDEAPSAYKPMQEIIANIGETAEIIKALRPLYNFKAAE